jgi:hypothetical protein
VNFGKFRVVKFVVLVYSLSPNGKEKDGKAEAAVLNAIDDRGFEGWIQRSRFLAEA